jgi:hypothetical protein
LARAIEKNSAPSRSSGKFTDAATRSSAAAGPGWSLMATMCRSSRRPIRTTR